MKTIRVNNGLPAIMTSKIRAIAVTAVICSMIGFGLRGWIYPSASAPDEERSSAESPVVSVISPADSLTSPTPTTPRNSTETKTISANDVQIEFDEQNPEAAMAKIKSLPDKELQRSLKRQVISETAQKDPQRALAMIDTTNLSVEDDFLRIVFDSWARQDMNAARAAVMELQPGAAFNKAAETIASTWAEVQGDRSEPRQWAMSLPPGEARNRSLAAIILRWTEDDPAAACNYAFQLNLPNFDITFIAEQWGRSDPQQALTWLNQAPWPDQQKRQRALERVMNAWATEGDPTAAANEVLRLPAGDSEAAIGSVVYFWAKADATAAAEWVNQLSAGSAKDRALASVAAFIAELDPAQAVNWAAGIGEENLRQEKIQSFARDWLRYDKVAATSWISSAPISEETRKKLLGR